MKLEIGGGSTFARGGEWVNIDMCKEAHIVHNLDITPWPIEDDSVDEIYSSHCIEHVKDPLTFLNECSRVSKIGARIEIRCPWPYSDLAMVSGHISVFSLQEIRNIEYHFPKLFWKDKKRPKFLEYRINSSERLGEAKKELPFLRGIPDHIIMKYIPGTSHEGVYFFEVVENEHQNS